MKNRCYCIEPRQGIHKTAWHRGVIWLYKAVTTLVRSLSLLQRSHPSHSCPLLSPFPFVQGCAVRCVKTVTMATPWDDRGRLDRVRDATATATWISTPWEYVTTSRGDVWNAWGTQRASSANGAAGASTGTPWTRRSARSANVSVVRGTTVEHRPIDQLCLWIRLREGESKFIQVQLNPLPFENKT